MKLRPSNWSILALTLLLGACAGSQRGAEEASRRFGVPGPGATSYSTEASGGEALRGPDAARLASGIESATAKLRRKPAPDARLAVLAQWIADIHAREDFVPVAAVLDFWAHHLGLVEPVPEVIAHVVSNPDDLPPLVAEAVAASVERRPITHYGGASIEHEGLVYSVVVLSQRLVHLAELRRRIEPGMKLSVAGSLGDGLRDPQLVVVFPDGSSKRWGSRENDSFAFDVPSDMAGEYRIELLAESDEGVTVAANFPMYIGVAPRTTIEVLGTSGGTASSDEAVEERLVALANRARSDAGLPALVLDERLNNVARAHSRDMRDHAFFGHTSATTGDVADRIQRAGIATSIVQENLGRGRSAEEVHAGLMDSPGHRANILNPQVTHIGVGVVSEQESEHRAFLATQVFIREMKELDLDEAPDTVLEVINTARKRAGLAPLVDDDDLSEIATRAARAFFSQPRRAQQTVAGEASKAAARSGKDYASYKAVLTLAWDLEDVGKVSNVLERDTRALGIGVAQGDRPGIAPGSIAVVLLLAY